MNNKFSEKVAIVASVFGLGVGASLESSATWSIAVTVGVYQGLKYKGSLVNGVLAGVATMGAIAAVDGVRHVIVNKKYIKAAFDSK